MKKPPLVVDDFLGPSMCELLMQAHKGGSPETDMHEYWSGRIVYSSSLRPEVQALMSVAVSLSKDLLEAHFEERLEPWYEMGLVVWHAGMSMRPHHDNVKSDGTPTWLPFRYMTQVIYLNDDYEGGETYFPDLGIEVEPRKGRLVGFYSTPAHIHGIKTLKTGPRYTFPMWYARPEDKQKIDDAIRSR